MQRTFAIGDIHGCAATFRKLLFEGIKITRDDVIYLLGDYIDRGPDSKGVVDAILKLRAEHYEVYTLRGNHEQLFMDSEKSFQDFQNWMKNGALATLDSFRISRYGQLDEEYKTFFEETQFYYHTNDCIFVHAGLNYDIANEFADIFSMLWIRGMEVDRARLGNKIIIHGHTPTPLNEVRRNLKFVKQKGSLNIDTGCVMKEFPGFGYLTALEVSTMQLYSVENAD